MIAAYLLVLFGVLLNALAIVRVLRSAKTGLPHRYGRASEAGTGFRRALELAQCASVWSRLLQLRRAGRHRQRSFMLPLLMTGT